MCANLQDKINTSTVKPHSSSRIEMKPVFCCVISDLHPDSSADELEHIMRAPPKVRTYEYNGFVLYLYSSLIFLVYILWFYLPLPFLHALGYTTTPTAGELSITERRGHDVGIYPPWHRQTKPRVT
jgi:hypothetical protein